MGTFWKLLLMTSSGRFGIQVNEDMTPKTTRNMPIHKINFS